MVAYYYFDKLNRHYNLFLKWESEWFVSDTIIKRMWMHSS